MILDFTDGFWLAVYRGRLSGDLPQPETRVMAAKRSHGVVPPDDLPNHLKAKDGVADAAQLFRSAHRCLPLSVAPPLGAKADFLRKRAARLCIARRDHRIILRQIPLGAMVVGRHAVVRINAGQIDGDGSNRRP